MDLPTPTPEEAQQFRTLYEAYFDVRLNPAAALSLLWVCFASPPSPLPAMRCFLCARESEEGKNRQAQSIGDQIAEPRQRYPDMDVPHVLEEARTGKEPGEWCGKQA